MNNNSGFGDTRGTGMGGEQFTQTGGQGAVGSGTDQRADFIPSSANSSQGNQPGSARNIGVEGGAAAANDNSVSLFRVPGLNNIHSMRFIHESGALFGVVNSLDANAGLIREPPTTGSFVLGPLACLSV